MGKPKVGFYGLTGCYGCLLSVIFNEGELLDIINTIDIVAFPFIKGKNSQSKMDICFIEGTVCSKDDLEEVKKLRKRSKVVVALGACSSHGNIPCLRNFRGEKDYSYLKYDKKDQIRDINSPSPIHKFIPIEYTLPGCPPDQEEIKRFIKEILLGMEFQSYPDPVCRECRLFENGCLLDYGKICLGPLTRGGCGAVCTTNGFECYGCRGITDDTDFEEYFQLMESKGIKARDVKKHMETFMAIEVNEKLKGTKWEILH